jgi:hypothetical protein
MAATSIWLSDQREANTEALIKSVTPAKAGVQFVEFSGFRLGRSQVYPEPVEGPE